MRLRLRAWDKKEKRLLKINLIELGTGAVYNAFDGKHYKSYSNFMAKRENDWGKFDDLIFMQATGLKDKYGNEIFEGDIVKVTDLDGRTNCTDCGIGHVEYLDVLGFYNVTTIEISIHELVFHGHNVEVIGNIYENKELLEVENE